MYRNVFSFYFQVISRLPMTFTCSLLLILVVVVASAFFHYSRQSFGPFMPCSGIRMAIVALLK